MSHWSDALVRLRACDEAVEWAKTQPSFEAAWNSCERGDWLLWLAARIGVDRRVVVLAACDCAELAAPYWRDDSILACVWAIDAARRWARGEAELEEVRAAADAAAYAYADAAADAAYAAYAADAAYAAANAAYADAAAYAAAYAADAAYAAYAAADAATSATAYAAAARASTLAECAALVRASISAADVRLEAMS